ncbi:MAG: putative damage-inducible protein DinB (forms a four-helix bundle) [Chloroflexi bacterium]|nr:MAG: putative damage-inducible protein DinB (forms a four-helix bundle) [Chloroflexota bacterium]
MLSSIEDFLRYFKGVHQRAIRDVAALPPAADGWRPAQGTGEKAWDINGIVGHMATSRLYFASAYSGHGWVTPEPADVHSREQWLPALEQSAQRLQAALQDTPDDWLRRKVPMIDTDRAMSGWRVLLLMTEHDIHHRSQIDTYAGINGWDPPDIYGRAAETIAGLQSEQRRKYRDAPTSGDHA